MGGTAVDGLRRHRDALFKAADSVGGQQGARGIDDNDVSHRARSALEHVPRRLDAFLDPGDLELVYFRFVGVIQPN